MSLFSRHTCLSIAANNIFITFTFTEVIDQQQFPWTIFVQWNTLIETDYLQDRFPLGPDARLESKQSAPLTFALDKAKYRVIGRAQTVVTFAIFGVSDFGRTVQTMRIWQRDFRLDTLDSIRLEDDVRMWNVEFRPSAANVFGEDEQPIATFEQQGNVEHRCYFYPRVGTPAIIGSFKGINTLIKTAQDCYDTYVESLSDPRNGETKVSQVRIAPVYYILAPSSCDFGPPDTGETDLSDGGQLKGLIVDPDVPGRIRLARTHG